MEYRVSETPIVGSTELLFAFLFGTEPNEEKSTPTEEGEIEDEAAADFYLSYFSYARPSAVHRPMQDGEGT